MLSVIMEEERFSGGCRKKQKKKVGQDGKWIFLGFLGQLTEIGIWDYSLRTGPAGTHVHAHI